MAGKKTGKRLLTWVLVLVMALSLLPLNALAEDGSETDSGSGMIFTKKLVSDVPDKDGNYTIQMTAQATGKEVETTKPVPMDIVLVLDQSGSMADDFNGNSTNNNEARRQYAMKAAVNSFIGEVADKYSTDADHHMAIVIFSDDAETLVGWTAVDKDGGASKLTDKISALSNTPSGATNVEAGMTETQSLMSNAPTGQSRQKTVIVFTDGVPTKQRDFDTTVADAAIAAAKGMKNDDVTIYTVGIFNGAKPEQLHGDKWDYALLYQDVPCNGEPGSYWGGSWAADLFGGNDFASIDVPAGNRFLNYLSSNFKNATAIGVKRGEYNPSGWTDLSSGTGYEITQNFNRDSSDYYKTASDASSLNGIFKTISDMVPEPDNAELNGDTVITDTLSNYFTFATGTADDVKVYAIDASGNEKESADATKAARDGVVVNGNTVTVTGYDFSAHYTNSNDPEKLVIEIKVKPDPAATWGPSDKYETNKDNATVTLPNSEANPIAKAESPKAHVDTYQVTYRFDDTAPDGVNPPEDPKYYISGQQADVKQPEESSVNASDYTYTFNGWKNGNEDVNGETIPISGNVTLTGSWSQTANTASYTVNYLWNGEQIQAPTTGDNAMHGDKITITDTSIDGYTLIPGQQTSMTIGTGENVLNLNYCKNVTLTSNSKTVTYNGKEQTVTGYTSDAPEGVTFEDITATGSGTNAGEYTVKFRDGAVGKTDTTGKYIVTAVNTGKLIINKRSVTLTSETASKAYDGTPLTKPTVTVTGDGFVDGEVTDIKATGSVTHVSEGEVTNTITFTKGQKFKDSNYDITKNEGKLEITPVTDEVTVTIKGNTDTKTYDGKEHKVTGYAVSIDNVLYTENDFKFTGDATATGTKVGTYDMGLTAAQFTNENTNFSNVTFEVTDGSLTITEAPTYTFDLSNQNTIKVDKKFESKYGRSSPTMRFEATVTIEKETYTAEVGSSFPSNRSAATAEPTYIGKATGTVTLKTGKTTKAFDFGKESKFQLEPGTYRITVKETVGTDRYVNYDDETYTYEFIVDNEGKINIDTPITCTFTNKYTKRHSAATPSKPTLNTGDHYAYVMGYPDGTVRPNGSITRAEVSAILFRLLSDKTRDEYFTTESSFTDVKAGAWYNNSIATLEKAGVIVDTVKGGAFRPNEAITRAELAAMLAQFSDAKPVKGVKFSDVSAEHWAYEAIAIAAKMGWIEGYPDGTFRPDATITRAEMMTLVNRALERVPSDEDHLLSKRVMLTFPDCKSGDWFYIAVQEATNSHTYERAATEKNGDEQWTALRANRDWTQLEK